MKLVSGLVLRDCRNYIKKWSKGHDAHFLCDKKAFAQCKFSLPKFETGDEIRVT